jgi:heme ABC exporter ATP-binding subunit CcmA
VGKINALVVKGLHKQIGAKWILKDVSFEAETGNLVVITGPNGAGKTTLLRILAGLLPKSGGEVLWNGSNYSLNHGRIGYIAHKPMLYETLSVQANLRFFGRMYGTASKKWERELLTLVDLWHYRNEPVAILSRGMQQRLALARVLVSRPSIILYDEPFTSLDQDGKRLLRGILDESRLQAIQLLITHEPGLLEGFCYGELKLNAGRVQGGADGAKLLD